MTQSFLMAYIQGCFSGLLKTGDCGPVWQLGVMLVLLLAAIGTLVFLRVSAPSAS